MQTMFSILLIGWLIFVSGGSVIAGSEYQKEQGEAVNMSAVHEGENEKSQKAEEGKEEAVEENKDMLKEHETAEDHREMLEEKQ